MKNIIKILIGLFILLSIGNEIFKQLNKPSAKSSRLSCHKKTVTFEKVVNIDLVPYIHKSIKSNSYKIEIWADKSKYMKSKLFKYVSIDNIKNSFHNKLLKYKSENKNFNNKNNIVFDIMVYENDKKDPAKKTDKAKLYTGYLELTVKVDNKVTYKIQTDFMKEHGEDIDERISCIIKSIISLGISNGKK